MKRAWFKGRLMEGDIALSPFDRGFTLGDGLFETMRVVNGKPFHVWQVCGYLKLIPFVYFKFGGIFFCCGCSVVHILVMCWLV